MWFSLHFVNFTSKYKIWLNHLWLQSQLVFPLSRIYGFLEELASVSKLNWNEHFQMSFCFWECLWSVKAGLLSVSTVDIWLCYEHCPDTVGDSTPLPSKVWQFENHPCITLSDFQLMTKFWLVDVCLSGSSLSLYFSLSMKDFFHMWIVINSTLFYPRSDNC